MRRYRTVGSSKVAVVPIQGTGAIKLNRYMFGLQSVRIDYHYRFNIRRMMHDRGKWKRRFTVRQNSFRPHKASVRPNMREAIYTKKSIRPPTKDQSSL